MEWSLTTTDGIALAVRPVGVADREAVAAFWRTCSAQSLRLRFMGGVSAEPEGSPAFEYLVDCDGDSRIGAAAFDGGRIVGVATAARTRDNRADLAVLVCDQYQGRGVGARLCGRVGKMADAAGMTGLVAECLSENSAVRAMTKKAGASTKRTGDFTTLGYEMEFAHRTDLAVAA